MKLVILESPLAATREHTYKENVAYARRALRDSLSLGESPIASHLLYPQVLDDLDSESRQLGMKAGWAWFRKAEACVVYTDHGISKGMKAGIAQAERFGVPVIYRSILIGDA